MKLSSEDLLSMVQNTQRLGQVKQKIGNLRYRTERAPILRMPTSTQANEKIGQIIGISGREFELLWQEVLEDPSEHEIEVIKNLILIAKLRGGKAIEEYNRQVAAAKDRYEVELHNHVSAMEQQNEYQAELDNLLAATEFVDLKATWASMIEEFQNYVESRDSVISHLEGDNALFFELLVKNSKHVRVEVGETDFIPRAVVNWDSVKTGLNIEHINTILRKWARLLDKRELEKNEQVDTDS